jgi:cyclopropane-fatty-acyl-phospholipid synthase
MIPVKKKLRQTIEESFHVLDWHSFGSHHYDKTLIAWRTNFRNAWPELKEHYGSKLEGRFERMWDYYLSSCAGAFRAKRLDVYQVVMAKERMPYTAVR